MVATGKPVVLLVFSGRPLVFDWAAQGILPAVRPLVPGGPTGPAIAGILFGDVAPSGKLTMSFPRAVGRSSSTITSSRLAAPSSTLTRLTPVTWR